MLRGFKFQLTPKPGQEERLRRASGCCRFVWNWFLAQKEAVYRASEGRVHCGFKEHSAQLPHLKMHYPWLATDALSQALQQTLRDLDTAYSTFFQKKRGHPRFKNKDSRQSFRVPQGFKVNGQAVYLPKIGWIRCRFSRLIPGEIRSVSVSFDGRKWHASFLANTAAPAATRAGRLAQAEAKAKEARLSLASVGRLLGIDWGIDQPLTLSSGQVVQLPRVSTRQRDRLAILQRRISSKKPGSKHRRKAVLKLRRLAGKIGNRRIDALHQVTTRLAQSHSLIAVEDLQVAQMTASAKGTVEAPGSRVAQKAWLNRSILDLSPGLFRRILEYKCNRLGCRFVAVPPAYSSQECSYCHHVSGSSRVDRDWFACVACGHTENADLNAAKVILHRAVSLLEGGWPSTVWCASEGPAFGYGPETCSGAA